MRAAAAVDKGPWRERHSGRAVGERSGCDPFLPSSRLRSDGRETFCRPFCRKVGSSGGRSPWPTIVYAMRVTAIALLASARTEDCGVFWSCLPKCLKDGIAGPFLASQLLPVLVLNFLNISAYKTCPLRDAISETVITWDSDPSAPHLGPQILFFFVFFSFVPLFQLMPTAAAHACMTCPNE